MRLKRRIFLLLIALGAVVFTGTLGFVLIDGRPAFEGFYMTLITLTSIGYGELWPMSRAARVFNVGVILVGVVVAFALIGTLTQAVIEAELTEGSGRKRMERSISKLKDHFIVCGVGRVGRSVIRELDQSDSPYVVVENSPERVKWIVEHDALLVVGDATREATLRQARIERARGLVAAVGADAENIYITLTARELNPGLRIIARASEEEAEKTLRRAGADVVISPYSYTGHRIGQALLRPNVLDFLDAATGSLAAGGLRLVIEEVRVTRGSALVGHTLEQSGIRQKLGIMVLAIKKTDGSMAFNPPSDAFIEAGDFLIAMGENDRLKKLEEMAVE